PLPRSPTVPTPPPHPVPTRRSSDLLDSPVMRTAACALGALAGVTLCMWAGFGLARVWFLAALTLEVLFFFKVRPAVRRIEHAVRSEEHTSELQSPDHIVCRLLLQKQ